MADDELKAFRVGDKHKPRVKSSAAAKAEPPAPAAEAQTFGFTRIEAILDEEPPDVVRGRLQRLHGELQAFGDAAGSAKERAAVKKGQAAVVRTAELIDYLFMTKAAMVAQATGQPKKKSGPRGKK